MSRTPAMGRRSAMREAVLAAAATNRGTPIQDLSLELEDETIPDRTARRLAVELAHEGLLEVSVTWAEPSRPQTVILEELTPIGRRYRSLLEDQELA